MGKQGVGVAKLRGFVILVNNTNPVAKVMVRITKVEHKAKVISQMQMGLESSVYSKLQPSIHKPY